VTGRKEPPSTRGTYFNAAVLALALLFGACSQSARMAPAEPGPLPAQAAAGKGGQARASIGYDQIGMASWYGGRHHGRRTASGTRFDMEALTAAHRSLPFGTVVLVENLANGRSIELRITDRGPYLEGRIIDLSLAAARRLGLEQQGVGLVGLTILSPTSPILLAFGP
jgi:rare lipoprotein A